MQDSSDASRKRHAFVRALAWVSAGLLLGLGLMAPVIAQGGAQAEGQTGIPPIGGITDRTPRLHALTDVRIVAAPGEVVDSGTVVVRDGRIVAAGARVEAPAGARIWHLPGRTVYAGFIDVAGGFGLEGIDDDGDGDATGPYHSNPKVRAERRAAEDFRPDAEAAAARRAAGITSVVTVPDAGIFRGRAALVNLGEVDSSRDAVFARDLVQAVAFETAGWPSPAYPGSLMGAITLIRQTLYDARWYDEATAEWRDDPDFARPEQNLSLDALRPVVAGDQRMIMAADDELDFHRILKIADEFDLSIVAYGNGYEYRAADTLARSGTPVIVPLDFPEPPAVEDPAQALDVSLEALQHWDFAPANAAYLAQEGVDFAFTSDGVEPGELLGKVRQSVRRGLDRDAALAALTTRPAAIFGQSDRLGRIAADYTANLVVASGDVFTDDEAAVELVFVDGEPYRTDAWPDPDPTGTWTLSWRGANAPTDLRVDLRIEKSSRGYTAKLGGTDIAVAVEGETLQLFPTAESMGSDADGRGRLNAYFHGDALAGRGETAGGLAVSFTGQRGEPASDSATGAYEVTAEEEAPLVWRRFPAGAYGVTGQPQQPSRLLVKDATLWTATDTGIIEGADMLIEDGEIVEIGTELEAPRGATEIDATGKHVTPGLIDAHSHTAISRGVNEGTHAVTVEARIGDVVDPTDIGLYRELAGGLTAANLLHGSANPMGGQSQVIKLRWGADAEALKVADAQKGVKFALGENVKQSNWGDDRNTRYPQTRMGVEPIMRDTFEAARAYGEAREARSGWGRSGPPLRRDLRLEAALEILRGEREVHIHSYRQDEILMFVRLAEHYGLDVAAFQHVLEGYKVAEAIASIGAGASTFSDWWAYKFEVYDAIPYNGALMYDNGVNVSFNSDSNELARRMNLEAAKAVKYGGVPREEAIRFVTINPAEQMGIAHRTGSLEAGKDADFVIWSGDPLSTYSRAEQTWIEGRKYFDLQADRAMRAAIAEERERLIQKALPERLEAQKVAVQVAMPDEEEGEDAEPMSDGQRHWLQTLGARELYHDGRNLHTCTMEAH